MAEDLVKGEARDEPWHEPSVTGGGGESRLTKLESMRCMPTPTELEAMKLKYEAMLSEREAMTSKHEALLQKHDSMLTDLESTKEKLTLVHDETRPAEHDEHPRCPIRPCCG